MKGYRSRRFAKGVCGTLCVCLLIMAAAANQITAQGTKADKPEGSPENEIKKASLAFSDAYVRGDTDAIRDLYTEDAVILPPGRSIRGNSKIAGYFAPNPNRENISHSMKSSELKIRGDMAVDIGMWNNTWKIGEAEAQSASGQYLVIWKRGEDGLWKIEYDMWHRPNEEIVKSN